MSGASAMARGVSGALVVGALGLVVAVAWPWLSLHAGRQSGLAPAAMAGPAAQIAATPALSDFAETERRPLFVSGRRLVEPVAAPVAPPASPRFDPDRLAGIVVAGDARVALIRDLASGRVRRVAEGEAIDGWIVKTIAVDRVVLAPERGGAAIEVTPTRSPAGERKPAAPRIANP